MVVKNKMNNDLIIIILLTFQFIFNAFILYFFVSSINPISRRLQKIENNDLENKYDIINIRKNLCMILENRNFVVRTEDEDTKRKSLYWSPKVNFEKGTTIYYPSMKGIFVDNYEKIYITFYYTQPVLFNIELSYDKLENNGEAKWLVDNSSIENKENKNYSLKEIYNLTVNCDKIKLRNNNLRLRLKIERI
jgi:hypothetical protein